MNTFRQKLKQSFTNIGQWFKKIGQNLIDFPRLKEYAAESDSSSPKFYFGAFYLTLRAIFKRLGIIALFGSFLALGAGIGFAVGILHDQPVPTIQQMDKQVNHPEKAATLFYAKKQKLANVKADEVYHHVDAKQITPLIKKAVIATEDETFYSHKGVLPKSLLRAIFSELTGIGSQTGGSTLTQQLVKMQFLTDQTTWKRKVVEMFFARKLEKHFTKKEIISAYLNVVPLGKNNQGDNIAGIKEAAKGIFGKKINELTLPEAAFIAGLPQSPSVYTPYDNDGSIKKDLSLGLRRKDIVLFRMYRNNDISKAEYDRARKYDLTKDFLDPDEKSSKSKQDNYIYNLVMNKSAELLADNLIEQEGADIKEVKKDDAKYQTYLFNASQLLKQKGYHVHTTIHKDLYKIMAETSKNAELGQAYTTTDYDTNLNKTMTVTEKAQNGAVMLDNQTGKVLAFSGGVDFKSSQINHAFDTYRSPGSSIKPYLVYAPAVENKLISSKTALPDFPTNFGKYIPTDYGNTVQNRFINADEALRMSYNLPAVNLYNVIRKKAPVKDYMKNLGFNISNEEYDELGLALGGTRNGFSVAQNAAAFASFSNDGNYQQAYFIDKIVDPSGKVVYQHKNKKKKVFSKATSYVMQKMLHEVTTDGTASQLDSSLNFSTKNLIGKTGTSNDYRDIWFNGALPGVTISSWIGYDNFYGHNYNLSSDASSINLNLWAKMANRLYKKDPNLFKVHQTPSKPKDVYEHRVLKKTGTKAGTVDYNGRSIPLSGQHVTALSLDANVPLLTTKFSIGAKERDYKSFYNYILGKNSNYGQQLYYSGQTISDNFDLDVLFGISQGQTDNSDYYGEINTNQNNNQFDNQVNANDQEPTISGGGNPQGNGSSSGSFENQTNTGNNPNQAPPTGGSGSQTENNQITPPANNNGI